MELSIEKKMDVTRQLEKETGQLNNLKEVLSRSNQVASNMVNILDSFEHRLAKLETTILPVYQQTGNLQRRQQNIEKTLQALDYVISYYNVAGQVESTIRDRPGSVGVPEYLVAMDKLAAACKYFQQHNPQSVELENVTTLFEAGTDALSKEFRDELKKYQRPIPPVTTLELVALEENELTEDGTSVDLVPPGVREDLRAMATWLDLHSEVDRLTLYAKLRADALAQSLQALRDHQRSSSSERSLGTPGNVNSPAMARSRTSKLDTLPKTRSNKISTMFERRANRMLPKSMVGQLATRRQGSAISLSSSSSVSPLHAPMYSQHGRV